MPLAVRFDAWVHRGPFSARDLSGYRIGFGVFGLLYLPTFRWIDGYPDSMFSPPPGPFALFTGFPPEPVLIGIEVAVALGFGLLTLGYRTRAVSLVLAVLLMTGYGFSYSLGRIDHTIALPLVPLCLAFSGWGDHFSVDAVRGRVRQRPTPQWPVRLLGLAVAIGFVTAATKKVLSGWLRPDTHAVLGQFYVKYLISGNDGLLSAAATRVTNGPLWEILDWTTVALELAFVVAILRYQWFRLVLASAALFHLGVLLVLDISFALNVVAYAAFVSWGAVALPHGRRPARGRPVTDLLARVFLVPGAPFVVAAAVAVPAWIVADHAPAVHRFVGPALVWAGAVGGVTYLTTVALRGGGGRRRIVRP